VEKDCDFVAVEGRCLVENEGVGGSKLGKSYVK